MDIVKTPKGSIAVITETNSKGTEASISFFRGFDSTNEKNAWWYEGELQIVDNLPRLLSEAMAHPFGNGAADVERFFGDGEEAAKSLDEEEEEEEEEED